jgi:trigger factor
VVEAATVTDTDGNVVDTSEFFGSAGDSDSEPADEPAGEDE